MCSFIFQVGDLGYSKKEYAVVFCAEWRTDVSKHCDVPIHGLFRLNRSLHFDF